MEAVETERDLRIKTLADTLLAKHLSKAAQVRYLQEKDSLVDDAISLLEKQGKVYVERHPVIAGGQLRTDLRPTDMVYFATFPYITRRTLLYKTAVEYGDFTINHVLGCSHGCQYPCYAMQMSKRYGRIVDRDDWMHPRVVGNALELLEKEIQRYDEQIHFVHLSFMTDPFMYDPVNKRNIPWIQELTLRIIEHLNRANKKATVLSKSAYPGVLTEKRFDCDNEYGITLVSMNRKFHETYEPFSITPTKRLNALRRLHDAGLKTWVSIEPYPTPNIVKQRLGTLLEKIGFVDKIIFGKWNYNPDVNGYIDRKQFYTQCADEVITFCREHNKVLHIKEHTPRSSRTSERLFIED